MYKVQLSAIIVRIMAAGQELTGGTARAFFSAATERDMHPAALPLLVERPLEDPSPPVLSGDERAAALAMKWRGEVALDEVLFAAAAGDDRAGAILHKRFDPLIKKTVAQAHRIPAVDTEDVVQEAWVRLLTKADQVQSPDSAGFWLRTTALRLSLRQMQQSSREILTDPQAWPHDIEPSETIVGLAKLESEAEYDQQIQNLQQALSALNPTQHRLVTYLLQHPEASYKEIHKAIGMAIGSIGPTRARAFGRMKQVFSNIEAGIASPDPESPVPPDSSAIETEMNLRRLRSRISDIVVTDLETVLPEALAGLSERERRIVELRFLCGNMKPTPIKVLADMLGVSDNYVYTLQIQAFAKLRAKLAGDSKPILPTGTAADIERETIRKAALPIALLKGILDKFVVFSESDRAIFLESITSDKPKAQVAQEHGRRGQGAAGEVSHIIATIGPPLRRKLGVELLDSYNIDH